MADTLGLSKRVLADLREAFSVRKLTVSGVRVELKMKGVDLSKVSDIELARIACQGKEG